MTYNTKTAPMVMPSWQVLLVTGGEYDYYQGYLDSTELMVPGTGSWRLAAGLLPRPMLDVRVATVANILYALGNVMIFHYIMSKDCTYTLYWCCLHPGGRDDYDHNYDEILAWSPDTEEWSLAARMIEARQSLAVSTITFEDIRDVCFEWTLWKYIIGIFYKIWFE